MDRTEITSFYFTRFTDEVTEMELLSHFRKWGEVKEIFIPKGETEKGGGMVSSVTKGSLIKEESKRNWITAS